MYWVVGSHKPRPRPFSQAICNTYNLNLDNSALSQFAPMCK